MLNLKTIFAIGVMMLCGTAATAAGVQLASTVLKQVETRTANGKVENKLAPVNIVTPGDRLVFFINYKNTGPNPANDIVITNPVPAAVAYAGPQDGGEPVVSVNGGKSFDLLAAQTMKNADGTLRPARTSDVTHVRWQITRAIALGEAGQVSFKGEVR
jgi:uncharacterized repeat protein (TIGR01451 family)